MSKRHSFRSARRLGAGISLLAALILINQNGSPIRGQNRPATVAPSVAARVQNGGRVRVIIGLAPAFRPEGALSAAAVNDQRDGIAAAQDRVLNFMPPAALASAKRFTTIPYMAMEVDAATLAALETSGDVTSIVEDVAEPPTLAESSPLVEANTVWARGITGAGWSVAVLDTGVDKTHSFLAGKVVSEACYSTTGAASSTSVCPGGVPQSTAVGSGVPCGLSISGCTHGTHVAGIAAGTSASFSGVARGANLIAVQVFSYFPSSNSVLSWESDQILGLERVFALRSTFNIASVNMSLGGGQFFDQASCDASNASRKAVIDNLRSVGIATVIASGNSGYTNSMGSPGCISSAVSVGSTDDGSFGTTVNAVSSFSNSASFLSLLAPGQWILSSVPGGSFLNFSGTSMATPHVAGAWALLKQANPLATVSQVLTALQTTGLPITDTRNGIIKPRIRLNMALNALAPPTRKDGDFDGDSRSDISVFRPSTGIWYVRNINTGLFEFYQWGLSGDIPVQADYDGDGKTDIAVWRPSTGIWYIRNSSNGSTAFLQWGLNGDIPVTGDFDGDGKADAAVFRPSTGIWYVRDLATNTALFYSWGLNGDIPVAADYDGDGKTDVAVWRPSTGIWYIRNSSNGSTSFLQWGLTGDKPVPGDYDGDGKADASVFRPSTGIWYVRDLVTNTAFFYSWGLNGDVPVSGDFDGDNKTDIAVFRPSTSIWYVRNSSNGAGAFYQWGTTGDIPILKRE